MSDYKPTEHGNLRKDGEVDQRTQQGFAGGKVDPVEAGKKGGSVGGTTGGSSGGASSGDDYKPTEHGGLKQDGTPDGRVKGN